MTDPSAGPDLTAGLTAYNAAGLTAFNELSDAAAITALLTCCHSPAWAERVAAARPYPDDAALLAGADTALAGLTESDLDDALAGHPRIGESGGDAASAHEQRGVAGADAGTLAELKRLNTVYEQRFGHVYLVYADGRPAQELLRVLEARLGNTPEAERREARAQLGLINRRRLERLLAEHDSIPGS